MDLPWARHLPVGVDPGSVDLLAAGSLPAAWVRGWTADPEHEILHHADRWWRAVGARRAIGASRRTPCGRRALTGRSHRDERGAVRATRHRSRGRVACRFGRRPRQRRVQGAGDRGRSSAIAHPRQRSSTIASEANGSRPRRRDPFWSRRPTSSCRTGTVRASTPHNPTTAHCCATRRAPPACRRARC